MAFEHHLSCSQQKFERQWSGATTTSTLPPLDINGMQREESGQSDASMASNESMGSSNESMGLAPAAAFALDARFDCVESPPWEVGRFSVVRRLLRESQKEASHLRDGASGPDVAVRSEEPRPWVAELGRLALLNRLACPYTALFLGGLREPAALRVVAEPVADGDLFCWCRDCPQCAGPQREALVLPLARQILDAVRVLHNLSVVHGNISPESILIADGVNGGPPQVKLASFEALPLGRTALRASGKPSYMAPEQHLGELHDGFLSDAFALGVVLYGMALFELPWVSTTPGGCKAFEYYRRCGFRALIARRKVFGQRAKVVECFSAPLVRILEGLLAFDPADRLTLGEDGAFLEGARESVWEEPWLLQM